MTQGSILLQSKVAAQTFDCVITEMLEGTHDHSHPILCLDTRRQAHFF